jgi:hypothetical protein
MELRATSRWSVGDFNCGGPVVSHAVPARSYSCGAMSATHQPGFSRVPIGLSRVRPN